jgi:hypothetical protein
VQFVFALTRGADGLVGGRLYRSDYYGKADTWDDRTNEMTGEQAAQQPCTACHLRASGEVLAARVRHLLC